jgi:acyl-CoA reductase-like NAD-dependent aldehyde dehydrogenase
MRPTEPAELDRAVDALANRKDQWARLPIADRIQLARRCLDGCVRTAEAVVTAACEAKGLDVRSPVSAEEWSGPVPVIRNIRLLIDSLSGIARAGRPTLPGGAVRRLPGGEVAVEVFPRDRLERTLFPGFRIDVWMQPDVTETTLGDTMALAYRAGAAHRGKVVLVLGAGNVSSIGPMDLLYKLFAENQVVVLKMHPVNDYLGPLIEQAFQPLIEDGYLRVVYGDAREGQCLIHHPAVDEVHMTGSAAVHDRIVWGDTPEEQSRRRAAHAPKIAKRITSELGCVTPVIVVPGEWSSAEIAYQAGNVATMVAHNASCNCNAAKLVVTWRGWRSRTAFLDRIEQILSALPARKAYYPGAAARYAALLDAHPQSRRLGARIADRLPCATIFGVDPASTHDPVFREEAWSPILAETALATDDEAQFLDQAVQFCNEHVAGTLSAVVLADPRSRARLGDRFDRAIADLQYGTVAVNHWSAVSYALAVAPWGAYPGHTLEAIGSGIGFVHNTLMFDRPLKTVLWGPFSSSPKPAWFCTHRNAHGVARKMVPFEASPSFWRVPGLALAASRG